MSSTDRKTWFVTGAASGLGLAFATHALARGHNVVATARDIAKLHDFAAQAPERVLALKLDVTSEADADAAVAASVQRFGRIDVLINNAGFALIGAVEETPMAELRAQMETNFFGAVAVTCAALPTLRAQRGGAVVNISSMGGQMSFAGYGAYSASKFALEGLSEALALEMAPFGVKVMIVEPGAFRTELVGAAMRQMPENPAYAESSGLTRAGARAMHGAQAGDSMKAAAAIEQALDAERTPLRLQLGADAVGAIRAHAQALLADLAEWERVAVDTALEDGRAGA